MEKPITPSCLSDKNLITLAEQFPNLQVTISLSDLITANRQLVEMTRAELEKQITDANTETYPSVDKVCEILGVVKSTLWRWEKKGVLVPIKVGGKNRYKMSDVRQLLGIKKTIA
ncbi:MAG: helix-turn-helix domain-containing protein [Candidatus Limisoma sp.]